MVERALFIGRFQPFHNGHLHAVNYILEQYDEVVLVVAAAQYSYTFDNPFTAGERVEMIKLGLGELYSRCYVIPVDNVASNYEWPRHVLMYTPRVQAVFSNNEFVKLLFEIYGFKVRSTPIFPGVSGLIIRRNIATGLEWRDMVPPRVASFIEEVKGVDRIKVLWNMRVGVSGERF